MIAKSLIAAAAVATTMALAPVTQAEAKTVVDIDINLGGYYPGYYPAYGGYPNHISCMKGRAILDYNKGFNKVKAFDCSLPSYKYTAWKNGHKFVVRLNGKGHITAINKLF